MQKRIVVFLFVASTFFINACSPAYVATQPTYVEVIRPPQPSVAHIWIGNEWVYNSRARNYSSRPGYWAVPPRGRTYQQGQWNSNNRGHIWISGRWN